MLTQPEPEGDTGGPSTSTDRSTKGKEKGKGKATQPTGFMDLVAQLQEQQMPTNPSRGRSGLFWNNQ